MIEPSFRWPDGFHPGQAALSVRNMRRIEQPAGAVWDTLVRATHWPEWYPNASHVQLPDDARKLTLGMRFRWTQTGIPLDCEVREFEPEARLAWFARSPLIQAYHGWDLQTDGFWCVVVTDETQRGILPRLFGPLLKPRMLAIHDRWLAGLESASGFTYDMSVSLPDGMTAADVVDFLLRLASHEPEAGVEALRERFGFSETDAVLAHDRFCSGIVRAKTRNLANRPDAFDDPVAYASFERAWDDPSIVSRIMPDRT